MIPVPGHPEGTPFGERYERAVDRIEARLDRSGDCWAWPGGTNGNGYGVLFFKTGDGRAQRSIYVHRAMFERYVRPLEQGEEVDHLCSNRGCARPDHLDAVSHAENTRRAAAKITRCPQGHPYDARNTSTHGGKRRCLTCQRDKVYARRGIGSERRGPYRKSAA